MRKYMKTFSTETDPQERESHLEEAEETIAVFLFFFLIGGSRQ